MAKITYNKLELKTDTSVNTITYNNCVIEIKKYLPVEEKNALIMQTLANSEENSTYNPVKLDTFFNLNIIYFYTNISFTETQKKTESKLYDSFVTSGLLDKIIAEIPKEEYEELLELFKMSKENYYKVQSSAILQIKELLNEVTFKMQNITDIAENFDPSKFSDIIQFATVANGGRPILDIKKEL